MKRLLVGGVPRCFQFARCFRRGEVGSRHNPEFLMFEWYRAFAGVEAVMADTERVVRTVARELTGHDAITVGGARIDLTSAFERLSVGEAFARYASIAAEDAIALASSDEERFFRVLVDEVEPALARSPVPVFLVDYPAPFASLARKKPSDPRVCERFELYVAGVELCNGFGELTDPIEQRARLLHDQTERRARGLPVYPIDERFLAALEEGMPPSAGNALGVDRLVALCMGTDRIADVLAFPAGWV
jgi:lysyl-tRNA synthetase class 2